MLIYQRDYFGFVYLWFDRKRKMFYVGSHMGSVDDGYVSSSRNMKKAYKNRPADFKRRIIEWLPVRERNKLNEMELKWLHLIKDDELGVRYYNKKRKAWGVSPERLSEISKTHWSDPEKRQNHIEGMKKSWSPERKAAYAEYMKEKWAQPEGYLQTRKKYVWTEERRQRQREVITESKCWETSTLPETRERMSQSAKQRASSPEYKKNFVKRMRKAKGGI